MKLSSEQTLVAQDMFNKALFGIRKQGTFAITKYGSCRYREESGSKCAIGHYIPDEKYRPGMENDSLSEVLNEVFGWDKKNPLAEFSQKLQTTHDRFGRTVYATLQNTPLPEQRELRPIVVSRNMAEWEYEMNTLATLNGLLYTPVSQ